MNAIVDIYLPGLIGFILQVFLFGFGVAQSVYYFRNNPDGWKMHTFVSSLIVLNAVSFALIADAIYTDLIANFGNTIALAAIDLPDTINALFIGTSVTLVQIFFARQAYLFTPRKKIISIVSVLLSLAAFPINIVVMLQGLGFHSEGVYIPATVPQVTIPLTAAVQTLSDILTVSTMCWQLRSHKEFMKDLSVIRFLLFCTFNRGLLVVVVQFLYALVMIRQTKQFQFGARVTATVRNPYVLLFGDA